VVGAKQATVSIAFHSRNDNFPVIIKDFDFQTQVVAQLAQN